MTATSPIPPELHYLQAVIRAQRPGWHPTTVAVAHFAYRQPGATSFMAFEYDSSKKFRFSGEYLGQHVSNPIDAYFDRAQATEPDSRHECAFHLSYVPDGERWVFASLAGPESRRRQLSPSNVSAIATEVCPL